MQGNNFPCLGKNLALLSLDQIERQEPSRVRDALGEFKVMDGEEEPIKIAKAEFAPGVSFTHHLRFLDQILLHPRCSPRLLDIREGMLQMDVAKIIFNMSPNFYR
jgi:hypothetical protein